MHEFGFLFVEMSKCTKYITNSQMNRGTHSAPEKKRTTDDKQQQYRKDTHQKLKWKK